MRASRSVLETKVSHRIPRVEDEPVELPIEESFDLHPFRPDEVRDVAREYLEQARARGYREVRLIHGRGRGMQRANVQSMLEQLDFVERFYDASSLGATVVVLRKALGMRLEAREMMREKMPHRLQPVNADRLKAVPD